MCKNYRHLYFITCQHFEQLSNSYESMSTNNHISLLCKQTQPFSITFISNPSLTRHTKLFQVTIKMHHMDSQTDIFIQSK